MVIALVALLSSLTAPLFAQASTEGKEFWVALTIGRGPEDVGTAYQTYICVSSKTRKGTVTILNPQSGWTKTYPIPAGTGWLEITDIPQKEIYPFDPSTTGQQKASGNTYDVGLKVTCSEEMSVFAALRYSAAFDASNILPITALQSEYIIQDYPAYANGKSTSFSNFCIVATEDNTQVDITPKAKTYDGKPANTTYTVTLPKAGDVYYVVSEESTDNGNKSSDDSKVKCLSGSYVKAKNGKKIAVFNGDICTRTPNAVAARDIHYEQAMPIDYWGTEFVITRSLEKDANRFRITAQEDGTQVDINGHYFTTINARETYEIELAVAADMKGYELDPKNQIVADAAYIKTSCPCAIYNYDTGNGYKCNPKENSQIYNDNGDPSMTWVSPIQQKISDVTFGVMNTDRTTRHFVNIITETQNIASVVLREISAGQYSSNMLSAADFIPVAGTKYSYARKPLSINKSTTYNLQSDKGGFIATVYGNGDDESYAYSAGSSAVKRGVAVDGENYTEGYISETVYCIGTPISFDAQVGTDVIDKVDWDFGDGISEQGGTPQTTHTYDSPGWYDIVANIYAHKECPYSQYPAEEVRFSFRVRRPDTISVVVRGDCLAWDDTTTPAQEIDSVQPDNCATDNFEIRTIVHGRDTRDVLDTTITARDQFFVPEENKWYYATSFPQGKGIVEGETSYTNSDGCTHTHAYKYDLTIITCLEMDVPNNPSQSYICPDDAEAMYGIPFHYVKGQIAEAYLQLGNKQLPLQPLIDTQDTVLQVPTESLIPGSYDAKVVVRDEVCDQLLTFDYRLLVYYPSNIFKLKFGNVLAVYTPAFNGGYTFTGYQWYKDGQPIEGATSSVYHTEEPFPAGSSYYVLLSRADGVILPSCEQIIPATDANSGVNNGANTNSGAGNGNNGANANNGNSGVNNAPQHADNADNANVQQAPAAEKIMRGNSLYIRLGNTLYDIYGNHIE